MRVAAFDYDLPPDRIAQEPAEQRDGSRLLILDRASGATAHEAFRDLPGLLRSGDLLVLNDSRVVPARLIARKPGGAAAEVLFLERIEEGGALAGGGPGGGAPHRAAAGPEEAWRALVRGFPRGAAGPVGFPGGLTVRLEGREEDGEVVRVRVSPRGAVEEALRRWGQPPLPPYIRREPGDPRLETDRVRYQTVYAASAGSVAAPTAGLHFTRALLKDVEDRGVTVASLTLHVGWGTFQPIRADRLEDHRMHAERFTIPASLAGAVGAARRSGGRVVAVGTTVVRSLEHAGTPEGGVRAGPGLCDLFIRPGHDFRVVDGLVTNFHLPRSTLLALVCAFAGRERVLAAYAEAVRAGYRFYSYGDAMVIL